MFRCLGADIEREVDVKVGLVSLTYGCRGHSKEYVDNLMKHLKDDFKFSLYYFNQVKNEKGVGVLDYQDGQFGAGYRKIMRRFICSLKFYFSSRQNIRGSDVVYFADYEYMSLILAIFLFFGKQKKIIWIHSAACSGGLFYSVYKRVFFYALTKLHINGCVVNGERTKLDLQKLISSKIPIHVVQYPSELSVTPVDKDVAKKKLGFEGKMVFSLLGMIRQDKDYEYAIKAFARSRAYNQGDAVLYIAGALSGVGQSQILHWLGKHLITNYVLNLNYLSESEVNFSFSASDSLLIPYGQLGSSQSGPVSLCRNYSLPVIARSGGEIATYLQREGVGFVCDSLAEFIDAIDKVYLGGAVLQFESSILKAKSKYSWAKSAKKYSEIFNGVLRENRS